MNRFISLILFVLLFASCSKTKVEIVNGFKITTEKKQRLKITGLAEESKGGAIVTTQDNSTYYVGNLETWKNKYANKHVRVSGKLVVITQTRLDSNNIVPYVPIKAILKRPIVRLLVD